MGRKLRADKEKWGAGGGESKRWSRELRSIFSLDPETVPGTWWPSPEGGLLSHRPDPQLPCY